MIGRNDPCWCGSGKKYKKCHMQIDATKGNTGVTQAPDRRIKSAEEIIGMRKAGAFNGELMDYIRPYVQEGISTEKLNQLVHTYTLDHGHTPACLGYHNFPKSVCISINNVVCHGIPSPHVSLQEGDIVNVDLTTIVDGFHGDSSETFMIGTVSAEARHLVKVTAQALIKGVEAVKPGRPLSDIGDAIEPFVNSYNCSVVRQYTGHGIGKKFHEHFSVYHHIAIDNREIIMKPGMTFTIEPMINLGDYPVVTDRHDGWTVRTKDGSLSAQYEHTVLVTEEAVEVLTLTPSHQSTDTIITMPE